MTEIVTIRASSLGLLFDCPAMWKAIYIDGKVRPSSGAAYLGTSVHRATGVFDQSRIDESGLTVDDAAGAFVDTLHHPDEEVKWEPDLSVKQAEQSEVLLTTRYCRELSPTMHFGAVEMQCDHLDIDVGDGLMLRFTGTLDRIYEAEERAGIADIKTGKRAVGAGKVTVDKHIYQLGAYELMRRMGEITTALELSLPAQIIGLQTAGNHEIAVGKVATPSRILTGDEHHVGLIEHAARLIKAEAWFGNPRSILCSERYCPVFHDCFWRAQA